MGYSSNEMKLVTGFVIDETALQQGVREAIGNVEKISEVRVPITIDGKQGVEVIRKYVDELNGVISSSQKFMQGANGQYMAGKESMTAYAEASNKAKTSLDALNNKVQSIDASFNKQKQTGKMVVENLNEYTDGLKVANTTSKKFSYQGQVLTETTTEYKDSLTNTTKVIKTFKDEEGNAVNVLDRVTKKTADLGVGLSDMMGTMVKVAEFQIITKALNLIQEGFTQTITIVKEYDDAITDLKKVSDLSGQALTDYTDRLAELTDVVGRTRTELVQLATGFKQAGFTDSDSLILTKVAALYQNVADSEVSAEEATAFVVSQMKAFDVTASGAISIVDKLNEVSNSYSVTNTDLATGLTKSASALKALGNTEDQTIGMITAGAEIMKGQSSTVAKG